MSCAHHVKLTIGAQKPSTITGEWDVLDLKLQAAGTGDLRLWLLQSCLAKLLLFGKMDFGGGQRRIAAEMYERSVMAGEILIKEGDTGQLYSSVPNHTCSLEDTGISGDGFAELLGQKPRAALFIVSSSKMPRSSVTHPSIHRSHSISS